MENLHLAFIMDGNRRWAVSQGKSKLEGHAEGAKNLERVLSWCKEIGAKEVTLYALSTENLKRTAIELEVLFKVISKGIRDLIKHSGTFNLSFLGRLHLLPDYIQNLMKEAIELREDNSGMKINFCIAYGGRQEIVDACNRAIERGEKVDDDSFADLLYSGSEPDLVVRTGGAIRSSNFLPYQTAYSEWFFIDTFWPAFSREEFDAILEEFSSRKRNFGK